MTTPLRLDYAVNDAEVIAAFKRQQAELEKERKAREGLQKQITDNSNAQKAADKAAIESAKAVSAEQARLAASAAKIAESVRTPMQSYKAGLAELVDHYKSGRLTQDEYRASADRLKQTYDDASGKTAKLSAAEKLHTAAVKEAMQIAEKYATKEERVAAELKRLNDLKAKGVLASKDYARAVAAENAKLGEGEVAATGFGGALGTVAAKMVGAVAGFASMSAVIGVIKSEYDALIERQGKSRDANISLAAEQEALLMNLGGADAGQVTGSIQKLSRDSGVKEEFVTRAVNEAFAARADLSVDDVLNAVGSASKIRKFAPSELAGLAGATIDTQKQTGLGTDESLGFLLQMQANSRTKNLKGLAENFTPAVGGVMNFGADRQTAGAMLAALSHGMGDTTGAAAATAGVSLANQLRVFGGGQDIGQTIAALQQDPAARAEFLSKSSFEVKALPAIESLLGGGAQAQQFAATRQALWQDPKEELNRAVAARNLPAMRLGGIDQGFGNAVDQFRLGDKEGAESAIVRTRMEELRAAMGEGSVSNKISGYIDDIKSGGMQSAKTAIENLDVLSQGMAQGRDESTEAARRSPMLDDYFRSADSPNTEENIRKRKNLENPEFVRQAKLLEEVVSLLKQQLAGQQNGKHAGVVAGRRENQMEGAR